MNQKLMRLTEPGMRLYFIALFLFAVATALFNPWVGLAEGAVFFCLLLYFRLGAHRRRKDILSYIETASLQMDAATRDAMVNAPLPMVIFRPETGEIIWSNQRFLDLTGEREHLFDTKLTHAVPEFDARWLLEGKHRCPVEVPVGERCFYVFGSLVQAQEERDGGFLATTYWVDVTEYADLRKEHHNARPVLAILLLDNYEELTKNVDEGDRAAVISALNQRITQWTAPTHGLLCRYDRDHYLFLFEARHMDALREGKFALLDSVREVVSPNGIAATLSIGIGYDAPDPKELFQYAALSIDMALSRGGDQVVLKNGVSFEFFGGRSREMEKRTRVKSRVMATALAELISDSSRVFIMGHKFPDLDSAGAAAGVCAAARKRGVPAHIILDAGPTPSDEMYRRLGELPEYQRVFLWPDEAEDLADSRTLLVVVDTNRPEQVQSEELLKRCPRVAVIDHHRRAATYIAGAALNFHEPYASSACELTTELIQYIMDPGDLFRVEAEALLAGIVLDTKNFTLRTGGRTFEAAAFLRRAGADPSEVRKLFQNDLEGTVARYGIIQTARLYRKSIAIARVDHTVPRVTAAQAADELLSIAGIDCSFVLFPDGDRVMFSARSLGETNVQAILEKLGGGGNGATAGAQMEHATVEQASARLLQAIDEYFESE